MHDIMAGGQLLCMHPRCSTAAGTLLHGEGWIIHAWTQLPLWHKGEVGATETSTGQESVSLPVASCVQSTTTPKKIMSEIHQTAVKGDSCALGLERQLG